MLKTLLLMSHIYDGGGGGGDGWLSGRTGDLVGGWVTN